VIRVPRSLPSILLVEDDPVLADQMTWALKDTCRLRHAGDRVKAIETLARGGIDAVLLDLSMPPGNTPEEGFRVLASARAGGGGPIVIVMSGAEERQAALRAIGEGAHDFLSKPVDVAVLRIVLARALERRALEQENRRLREQLRADASTGGIVGVSPAMLPVFEAIRLVKDNAVTVFLQGESGTGKELVARAIHNGGSRREGPFVPVHCAALPETLLEAELFGHERGAFTGAVEARMGRFEAAQGGTLFLDEIGTLSGGSQVKLLRVLEERTVQRIGSNRERSVDLRLVAASNEDLEEMIRQGFFREDLFFRLHVFPIRLPALRERPEDIPLLADHFLKRICDERGIPHKRFSAAAKDLLAARPWPGNVRELRNLVEMVSLVAGGDVIEKQDIPGSAPGAKSVPGLQQALRSGFKTAVEEFEKWLLEQAIARAGGGKMQAARDLGLDPGQMKYLVKKHGL
jgi:two-component system NtrC family response regulator